MDHANLGSRPGGGEASSISSTLLERLRAQRPEAWGRLVDLYGPVVYGWCRRLGVRLEDAADVVQEVFGAVAVHLGSFRRRGPSDSFGAWLRTIARNKVRDHFRRRHREPQAQGGTDAHEQWLNLGEPEEVAPAGQPPEGETRFLRRALDLVRAEFENRTWDAFWRTAIDAQAPVDVAEQLGMSLQAVYKAKSRVLRRLRQELAGLLE